MGILLQILLVRKKNQEIRFRKISCVQSFGAPKFLLHALAPTSPVCLRNGPPEAVATWRDEVQLHCEVHLGSSQSGGQTPC